MDKDTIIAVANEFGLSVDVETLPNGNYLVSSEVVDHEFEVEHKPNPTSEEEALVIRKLHDSLNEMHEKIYE